MITSSPTVVIFGSNGAIGNAFVDAFAQTYPNSEIHACARHTQTFNYAQVQTHQLNDPVEQSLANLAEQLTRPVDCVIVATGLLHTSTIRPEKSLAELSADKLHAIYDANVVFPALVAKYLLPKLNKHQPSVFAALSARVGSISDNRLGGWYAYRASKAALNMIIKNAAIETARRNPQAIVVGLHPGTVDSDLSKPFQAHVAEHRLFSPATAAQHLLGVLAQLTPNDTGACFAWDGQVIAP